MLETGPVTAEDIAEGRETGQPDGLTRQPQIFMSQTLKCMILKND